MFGKIAILILACTLLATATFFVYAQDEIILPEPTGSYNVGRAIYHLIDENRPEVLSEDPDDVRELIVYVYYPSESVDDADVALYVQEPLLTAFNDVLEAPPPFSMKVNSVKTHSYENAPLTDVDAPYPVVLFMPGFGGMPWNYASLVEELASQGYVVFATFQPYHSVLTVFPNGRVVTGYVNPFDPPPNPPETDWDLNLQVWSADAEFVLDELVILNETDDMLAGMLDLEQIGMAGHSMGGRTGLWIAQNDDRVDAVINLDGPFDLVPDCLLCQDLLEKPIDTPLLIMSPRMSNTFGLPENGLIADGTFLQLNGAVHMTFSDDPLIWGNATFYDRNMRLLETINAYMVIFFDKYVKKVEDSMPVQDSDLYPDARLSAIE